MGVRLRALHAASRSTALLGGIEFEHGIDLSQWVRRPASRSFLGQSYAKPLVELRKARRRLGEDRDEDSAYPQASSLRSGMSEKSSPFIVTSADRCTKAWAAIMRSRSFLLEYPARETMAP